MDSHKKPVSKCTDVLYKGSSFLSILSMLFTVLLCLRMEAMDRKTDMIDKRVGMVENDLKMATFLPTEHKDEKEVLNDFHNNKLAIPHHHAKRARRSDQQFNGTSLSLEGIRKEIDKKFIQACSSTGKICQVGPSGPPGNPGAPGYTGYKGEKGAPGKTGSHGPVGPAGPQGQRGEIGPVGGQGHKGDRGDRGPTGEKGAQGSRGINGPRGDKGTIGSKGTKGDPGASGYPGYKGEKGAHGKTGPHGPVGPTGPQGHKGKVGPVGGQGLKGDRGDKGPTGEKGEKGSRGIKGLLGVKGSFGSKGVKGNPGSVGRQGPKGNVGRVGGQGLKGDRGHNGPTGQKGAKGSRGITGPPGVKGPFGSKGAKGYPGSMGRQGQKGECVARPSVLIFPKSLDVFVNQLATFYCWVQGQKSSAKVTWSRLGSTTPISSSVGNEAVLHFSKVQKPHSGWYMCTVQTAYGNLRAVSALTVYFTKKDLEMQSCDEPQKERGIDLKDGPYFIRTGPSTFEVYCDMTADRRGWTLIARFSNSDSKTWMNDNGYWWYNQKVAMGTPTNPSVNADMISPAFWLVSGRELKITRSDDSSHTPLLQTTGNCLGGQTFRSKVTSYGDFRNGKVWSSDKCLGSCTVQYGGQYKSTDGFQQAECSSNIQSAKKIGFWCCWGGGDGAAMMIGGGGSSCARADHGIGITEADYASFVDPGVNSHTEYDFGYDARTENAPSTSHSLNLWIR